MDTIENALATGPYVYDPSQDSLTPDDRRGQYESAILQRLLQREEKDAPNQTPSSPHPPSLVPISPSHSERSPSDPSRQSFTGAGSADTPSGSTEHVKRPRNAFMLFRSEFNATGDKINPAVEHDHRHISRIAGHLWNQMPEDEKKLWQIKAAQEKREHARKYPNYKFAPAARAKKPRRRNVKRNGDNEMMRCKRVADLLLEGKQGQELVSAIQASDREEHKEFHATERPATVFPHYSPTDYLAFNDPMLSPAHISAYLLAEQPAASLVIDRPYGGSNLNFANTMHFNEIDEMVDRYARSMPPTTPVQSYMPANEHMHGLESPIYIRDQSPDSPLSPSYPLTPIYGEQFQGYRGLQAESYMRTSFGNGGYIEEVAEDGQNYGCQQGQYELQATPRMSSPVFSNPFEEHLPRQDHVHMMDENALLIWVPEIMHVMLARSREDNSMYQGWS